MIITIDGESGVGKTTVANKLCEKLDFFLINSGRFYRSLAYYISCFLQEDIQNIVLIEKILKTLNFSFENNNIFINNSLIKEECIYNAEIDQKSSILSSFLSIRKFVNKELKKFSDKNIVAEGRDMGRIVFPNADYKIYLTASLETRALRRYNQKLSDLNLEELQEEMKKRDYRDKNKENGALKNIQDALYLEVDYLTIDEVCEKILMIIKLKNIYF